MQKYSALARPLSYLSTDNFCIHPVASSHSGSPQLDCYGSNVSATRRANCGTSSTDVITNEHSSTQKASFWPI